MASGGWWHRSGASSAGATPISIPAILPFVVLVWAVTAWRTGELRRLRRAIRAAGNPG
ncbi:hypothetical protein [Gordonia bronchialis]|uniref:hypothetical protein n=1 Tax=Gordonia bronchialis TaxID=2054 RepID=UPI0024323165|nr:hypothetical protein [Gordonia bronchialis]